MKLAEELRGVGGVACRVERLRQGPERVRVVEQVDLHAADIDGADARGLERADRRDRGRLGGVEMPIAVGVHRPRPGKVRAGDGIAAAALHLADRAEEARRNGEAALGADDAGAAELPGARRERPRRRRRRRGEQPEQQERQH
jgi:hypothetical protein